jgi:hypothetical protein
LPTTGASNLLNGAARIGIHDANPVPLVPTLNHQPHHAHQQEMNMNDENDIVVDDDRNAKYRRRRRRQRKQAMTKHFNRIYNKD